MDRFGGEVVGGDCGDEAVAGGVHVVVVGELLP